MSECRPDPIPVLKARDALMQSVRAFFYARGFLEVETPVRLNTPCLEDHIDAIPADGLWLRTSPELHLKRLLAAGCGPLFSVGPCFRRGERGRLHHPEYTMLEWYRPAAGYLDILENTRQLIGCAQQALRQAVPEQSLRRVFETPWRRIRVADAFLHYAGWNPVQDFDADRFDLDLLERVEPALKTQGAVVLYDYPVACAALARRNPDDPAVAERWELYLDGVEIANAYSELTDPVEQRERFERCARFRRAAGRAVYPLDEAFLQALEQGLPECGGIALGVDRLLMVLLGADSLDAVLPFREG
jgi:lysyl-tRNA synthetase class 2